MTAVGHGIVNHPIFQRSNLWRVWITIFDLCSSLMMEIYDVNADKRFDLQLRYTFIVLVDD